MQSDLPSNVSPKAITVVLPAFNEAKHIRRTLEALCEQTLPAHEFEAIVVDNGSTDGTVTIAREFAERLSIQVVTKTGRISAVRNYGASLACGQVLAFLDADCTTSRDWLERSLALGRPCCVWGAHYLVPVDSTWVGRVWAEYQARPQEGPASFIPGSNLFMHTADFVAIGGFGEDLETSEDVELSQRARRNGMSVLAYPSLAVYHEGTPQTLRHFYRQNRWHGTTVLRIFLKNLPSTTNLPLVALSIYTLLLFWATLLLWLSAPLSGHVRLALGATGLLLFPALLLSAAKVFTTKKVADLAPLFVLYLTYLLARAASITKLSKRNHR